MKMNSPRFQTGNNAEPLSLEAVDNCVSSLDDTDHETTIYGGELKTLLDGFLEIIIKSIGASAGAIRMLSPSGRELYIAGAVGLPPAIYRKCGCSSSSPVRKGRTGRRDTFSQGRRVCMALQTGFFRG